MIVCDIIQTLASDSAILTVSMVAAFAYAYVEGMRAERRSSAEEAM